jgi:hypothetical protein
VVALALAVAAAAGCAGEQAWGGCAGASIVGGSVEVGATRPGAGGGGGGGRESGGGGGAGGDHGDGGRADADESLVCTDPLGRCGEYEVVMRDEPTLSDVASFAPRLAPLVPEPGGFGIAGLPVNVVAAATTHTQTGELFDLPVTVRFRPVSYRFDYGDGATTDSSTGGLTWDELGAAPFTPTATSHIYQRRGTYTLRAAVHFAADVDFGAGWERVPGLLALPAGTADIRILQAHTALVERTCLDDPSGTGC